MVVVSISLALGVASSGLISGALVSVAYLKLFGGTISCCKKRCEVDPVAVQPTTKGDATRFSWAEIESATGSFDPASVIGEGGSGAVYLARLPDSTIAAVKLHRSSGFSDRLRRAFRSELDALARSRHPNIVRLLGYCDGGEDAAIVLEHVPNGNLHDKLHGDACRAELPWARRVSIALRVAEAVAYLHEVCEPQVIHGDITAANVLLDERLDPKLCDFGSARTGFSASGRFPGLVVVSPGYADPHYLRTGTFSKKSDVYSFGVLLMELITGIPAFRRGGEGPLLLTAREVVDDRLGGEYDVDAAAAMVSLARLCLADKPSIRPSMKEVVRIISDKVSSSAGAVDERSSCKPSRGCDL